MGVPGVKRPTLAVAAARLARTGDLAGFREREGGGDSHKQARHHASYMVPRNIEPAKPACPRVFLPRPPLRLGVALLACESGVRREEGVPAARCLTLLSGVFAAAPRIVVGRLALPKPNILSPPVSTEGRTDPSVVGTHRTPPFKSTTARLLRRGMAPRTHRVQLATWLTLARFHHASLPVLQHPG